MNDIRPESLTADDTMNLDQLQAALYFLVTRYTSHPCPHIAERIVEHLVLLCNHPSIELLPIQHELYAKSINYWRSRTPHTSYLSEASIH